MAFPLFPNEDITEPRKVNNLFDEVDRPVIPKMRTLFEEEAKAKPVKSLFNDEESKPKAVKTLFQDAPIVKKEENKDSVEGFYLSHPLLKGVDKLKIKKVIEIEKSIQINSSVYVVHYAESIQQNVSNVMADVAAFSMQLLEADVSVWVNELIIELKKISIENFKGFKPSKNWFFSNKIMWTVRDYIETYNLVSSKTDSIIKSMNDIVNTISDKFNQFDKLFSDNQQVIVDLDCYVLAGKVAMSRFEGQLFKDFGSESCQFQFGEKINNLDKLQTTLELNTHQIKLMQNNFMTKLSGVRSIIGNTYPIWKSNFAILLTKWQSSSSINLDTEIASIVDIELNDVVNNHKNIIDNLSKN